MIKFLRVLFEKLIKKKEKSIGRKMLKAKRKGKLPYNIDIEDEGNGFYKITSERELSIDEITEIIQHFMKEEDNE